MVSGFSPSNYCFMQCTAEDFLACSSKFCCNTAAEQQLPSDLWKSVSLFEIEGSNSSETPTLGQSELTATQASTTGVSESRVCLFNSKWSVKTICKILKIAAILTFPFRNYLGIGERKFHRILQTFGQFWNYAIVLSLFSGLPLYHKTWARSSIALRKSFLKQINQANRNKQTKLKYFLFASLKRSINFFLSLLRLVHREK